MEACRLLSGAGRYGPMDSFRLPTEFGGFLKVFALPSFCLRRRGRRRRNLLQRELVELFDRVADAYVQATRLKASAPDLLQVCNTRF